MAQNTLSAGTSPDQASALIEQALAGEPEEATGIELSLPGDLVVALPGGFMTVDGDIIRTASVRELTGRDEEAIFRHSTAGAALNTALVQGVTHIGTEPCTEALLDRLLIGDREALLVGIFTATFGNPAPLQTFCAKCREPKEALVDITVDITQRIFADPLNDRVFEVKGKKSTFLVTFPDGKTQKELTNSGAKSGPELSTVLLRGCIVKIDNHPVYSDAQIQNLGIADRRKISAEIAKRNPGPIFEDTTAECPDCGAEVVVPISIGALFRF
jgi:hypothetical protein